MDPPSYIKGYRHRFHTVDESMKETKEERTTLLDVMAKDNLIRDSLKRTFKYVKEKTKRPKYTKLGLPKMKIVI